MKSIMKKILMAIPALVVAVTVGLVSVGCDDSTTSTNDLSTGTKDLISKG